jgi:hypothetical protein
MFAPAMRGLTWGGPAGTGGRHDRRALTNFSVQVLHLIVGDDKVSVGMRVFAAVRMFLARHANREAELLNKIYRGVSLYVTFLATISMI